MTANCADRGEHSKYPLCHFCSLTVFLFPSLFWIPVRVMYRDVNVALSGIAVHKEKSNKSAVVL